MNPFNFSPVTDGRDIWSPLVKWLFIAWVVAMLALGLFSAGAL